MTISINIHLKLNNNFLLDIDTQLPEGKIIALYGDSGSGKTTLLRCIAGLQQGEGEIYADGQHWQNHQGTFLASHKRDIGFVFQDGRLFPHLSIEGNLRYAEKRAKRAAAISSSDLIEQLGLSALLSTPVLQLSAGQQQRVAIARSLLSAPRWLLMDEPLSNLDYQSKNLILTFLEKFQRKNKLNILYISHDMEEVSRIAEHLLLMEDGKIIDQGPLIDISSRLDLKLAHRESAAAVVEVIKQSYDPKYNITSVHIGKNSCGEKGFEENNTLQLSQDLPDGAHRLRIPARDVSIALNAPQQSSILNTLPAVIDAIEHSDSARVLIRLKLGDQYILARLTHKSLDQLQLCVGQKVYAQIKSVALLSEPL